MNKKIFGISLFLIKQYCTTIKMSLNICWKILVIRYVLFFLKLNQAFINNICIPGNRLTVQLTSQ